VDDEVSHGELDPRTMDAVRARAIHIHDELAYADASAYFAMHAMWDSKSNSEHFGASRSLLKEEDTIVLIDIDAGSVMITGTGMRSVTTRGGCERGAVRVDATSDDPLVMVSAFTNRKTGKASFVIINNAPTSKSVRVHTTGAHAHGGVDGLNSHRATRGGRR
jgi:hypothetical protein